jgi:outer membrane cobalamin receptor
MKQNLAILAFTFFLSVCLAGPTSPNPDLPTRSDSSAFIYTLEEIVVYGVRTMGGTSMTTEILAEEIQKRNAVTVADILRSDPGLEVTTGPKAETETRIRGFPGQDVLVLVDGRPINPGYYGKVDLSMLPQENIAKLQVIKGPASAAYGANAMGGVINIVTKNGLETPRTIVESEFGDYEFRKLSINHSRRIGRFNYWLSGYENYAKGYALSEDFEPTSLEDGRLRNNSSYHKTGFDGKLGFQPSAKSLYALSLGYHWAEKNVPTTIYSWDSPTFRTFPSWKRFNSAFSGNWHLNPKIELKSAFFVDAQHDRLIEYNSREMREDQVAWDSKLENWTVGGLADAKIRAWRKHWIQVGLSYKRDLMHKKPDVDAPWDSHYIHNGTIYFQENYRPWDKTEIAVGASDNSFGTEKETSSISKLCPMASVRQELPWEFGVRASYANAIRFPTLHHLYDERSGNPDLKAEQADKFEVGLERDSLLNRPLRFLSVEVAFFHNELANLIYRESRSYQFKNIGKATLQGWELRTRFEFSRYLSGDIGYGRIDPERSSALLLQEVSPNRLRALLTAETNFGLQVNYEFNSFDERTTYMPDWILPHYEIHSMNISQRIGKCLRVHLKVSNLTDADYEEELGYPAPGRQFFAGMTWSF